MRQNGCKREKTKQQQQKNKRKEGENEQMEERTLNKWRTWLERSGAEGRREGEVEGVTSAWQPAYDVRRGTLISHCPK